MTGARSLAGAPTQIRLRRPHESYRPCLVKPRAARHRISSGSLRYRTPNKHVSGGDATRYRDNYHLPGYFPKVFELNAKQRLTGDSFDNRVEDPCGGIH